MLPVRVTVTTLTATIIVDLTNGGRQFTFNGDNKQTLVKDANNQTIGQYFYDGEGKRVKKITATETTIFVYSGSKLIAEYSTATPPQNPTTNYVMTDVLQSVRAISDSSGQVTSRRDFMPFGEELLPDATYRTTAQQYGSPNDRIRQKFTGYQKDEETNLDFAEARMYQTAHGRFTAVDPLLASGKSADPQTFNRYAYAMNRPLVLRDPSGLQAGAPDDEVIRIDTYWDSAKNTFGTFEEYLKSIGRSIRNFALNSDALQNANQQRFQNRMDALNGDPAAAEALSGRLVGNQGANVDSVLQGTTDGYKRAETAANVGFTLSNITLGLAGMVGPGSASVTTNRGFSIPRFGSSEPPTLDLFGGKSSQIPGAINLDLNATSGVRGSTTALPFRSNYFTDVVASGPRAEFLPEASRVMAPGGQLFINSTRGNSFGQLPRADMLQNYRFRVVQENGPLAPRFSNYFFRRSDGSEIPRTSVRTTILERF